MDRAGKDWFKKDIEILRMNAVRRMRWTSGEGLMDVNCARNN